MDLVICMSQEDTWKDRVVNKSLIWNSQLWVDLSN